jgi:alpha-D-xyloside xylohydrolase
MEEGMVRWSGFIASDSTGLHKFRFYSAGYSKVWLNGKLVVDRWRQSWNPTTTLFELEMEKDKKYPLRIEWLPDGGESYISLKCLSPQIKEEQNKLSLYSELANQIDYYFIKGDNIDEVISGYRELTGKAPIMPKWAMGFWQSRERYKSQDEILNIVKEFRNRKIPIDNIVLDWQYWRPDQWGSHEFDSSRFPDPKKMIDDLHNKFNVHLMISVWPKFYTSTEYYKQMEKNGWLYKLNIEKNRKDWIGYVSTFYDAFNSQAREFFWNQLNKHLFSKGVDAWWLDASEPDMQSNVSIEERQALMNPTALGPGAEYFNAFSLENAKGVYEGQRKVNPDQRVFILTRSAYAGQQRYAAATWSGDIGARWEEMKLQIPAALNFSISGIPYWTMDIGGFAVERRYENAKGADLEEWRELMTRWYQFGAFCPIFRAHGQLPYREIFNVAPENHPAYKAILASDQLRYRLMPYIYSLAGQTYFNNYTIMRALVMDFASDTLASGICDQYMFGPSLLVCPVYEYKTLYKKVYLPANTGWYDLFSGMYYTGGQTIDASAPLSKIPTFVKEGSILPVGPDIQYTTEKSANPISLFIYTGKNGSFNLYEDENVNYNYEKGFYSFIPLTYDENTETLIIGDRIGKFPGMIEERIFNIIWITGKKPVPFNPDEKPVQTIKYTGKALKIKKNLN